MNRISTPPVMQLFDTDEVRRTLQLLLPAGQVTELRILDAVTTSDRWPHTAAGYFDDAAQLIAALDSVRSAKAFYIVPNPVNPALLARAVNRIRRADKGGTTSDNDVIARRWLLIDCDPQRPAGISATGAEHDAALDRCRKIWSALHYNYGWPEPIAADSGNGGHLLYAIDLPADDGGLVQRCLAALAAQFDDDAVKVDTGVFNPARIWKLYGTLAGKGDSTTDRPHRMSRVLSVPDQLLIVTASQLEELASEAPTATPHHTNGAAHSNGATFDIDSFISRHGFEVDDAVPYQGGRKWTFRKSPLCDHHSDGPYLIQFASGALSAGCHHNSCAWTWHDLRAKFEPKADGGLYDRLLAKTSANGSGKGPHSESQEPDKPLCNLRPVSEFIKQCRKVEYLIPFAIVAGQGGIVSAKMKSLKTTISLDANVSMASATKFLGEWEVPAPVRCGILSGESGEATIKADLIRIARARGLNAKAGDLDNCFVDAVCPRLQSQDWLDEIRRVIDTHELRCLTIDPTYLAAAGVKQNDLSAVAAMLEPVSRIIQDTGCTIIMVHHNRKVSEIRYGCPTLEEITGSGFGEWARFWLLLNRRREWDDQEGRHWLWLVTGGSAGFGSRKWLDALEGKPTDPGGRLWEVEIVPAGEGEAREKAERESQKQTRETEQRDADKRKLIDILRKCDGRREVKSELEARAGMNGTRITRLLAELLESGDIVTARVKRGNGREYDGFALPETA